MDDKEIEKKMEALGKEVGKKKSELNTEAEKGESELQERKAAFERINAEIIEPSLEFLKSLASKGGIAISVEKCGGGHWEPVDDSAPGRVFRDHLHNPRSGCTRRRVPPGHD